MSGRERRQVARTALPVGIAAIAYWRDGRPIILISKVIDDRIEHGIVKRAARSALRGTRAGDYVTFTFDVVEAVLAKRRGRAA